jgi:hypothetical protein
VPPKKKKVEENKGILSIYIMYNNMVSWLSSDYCSQQPYESAGENGIDVGHKSMKWFSHFEHKPGAKAKHFKEQSLHTTML